MIFCYTHRSMFYSHHHQIGFPSQHVTTDAETLSQTFHEVLMEGLYQISPLRVQGIPGGRRMEGL